MSEFGDLPENQAIGRIAEIYNEIRYFSAVPYVSSLQRQLATVPGCLEWLWEAVRPVFANGRLPEAAWSATQDLKLPVLPAIPAEALSALGVDSTGRVSLRDIYATFLRASPVNMATAGAMRHLLDATMTNGRVAPIAEGAWTPPVSFAALPNFPTSEELGENGQALLSLFTVDMGGKAFVPGLFRLLAHWPSYLAHVAVELTPLFNHHDIIAVCSDIVARIDTIGPALAEELVARKPPFDTSTAERLRVLLHVYRGTTSPQMIVFSNLLRDALPTE
tara:strand:+ start:71 stop:901 length:831 start_codon:yes stop_codon:yes gene_type:complete